MSDVLNTEMRRRGRPPKVRIEALGGGQVVETDDGRDTVAAEAEGDEGRDEAPPGDAPTGADRGDEEGLSADAPHRVGVELVHNESEEFRTVAPPWQPIATAPLNGKPVWLLGPAGETQAAYFYHTRQRERAPMRWTAVAYWTKLPGGGLREKVGFEPVGWQRYN